MLNKLFRARLQPISHFPRPLQSAFRATHIYRNVSSATAAKLNVVAPESISKEPLATSAKQSLPASQPYGGVSSVLGDEGSSLGNGESNDWSKSYYGLSTEAFPNEISDVLLAPLEAEDIEIKPDGLIYLPEIKYRRVLNKAFRPGGWGLAPRSQTNVSQKIVSREYALVCLGRLVAIARGEQEYFDPSGIATAAESCKSNALMRCCKDLGVASELWDPRFIRGFKSAHCIQVLVSNSSAQKKKLWRRKDQPKFEFPWKE